MIYIYDIEGCPHCGSGNTKELCGPHPYYINDDSGDKVEIHLRICLECGIVYG